MERTIETVAEILDCHWGMSSQRVGAAFASPSACSTSNLHVHCAGCDKAPSRNKGVREIESDQGERERGKEANSIEKKKEI